MLAYPRHKNLISLMKIIAIILIYCTTLSTQYTTPNCWWDSDVCIPCTICDHEQNLIVLRPCQLHSDTICGKISDLEIDWMIMKRRNHADDQQQIMSNLNGQQQQEAELRLQQQQHQQHQQQQHDWDWQAASFLMIIIACFIFISAIAFVYVQHVIQWRKMEKRLDRELSAKLMAKLAENNEKCGSFLIENPIKNHSRIGNPKSLRVHCIILDQFLDGKDDEPIKPIETDDRYYIEGN